MFYSATHAVYRYLRLRQLLASCRSIPLGSGKTHISRTESFERWETIRQEFATLARCLPPLDSIHWHVLILDASPGLDNTAKRNVLGQVTGKSCSLWFWNKYSGMAWRTVSENLHAHGLLSDNNDVQQDYL